MSTPSSSEKRPAMRAWLRLLRVHKTLLAEARDELSGDVTLPRFDLLSTLERKEGQTLAALSRQMLVTAGNLTGLVDRAERDGLVERRAVSGDRRATHVYLTPRGKKLLSDAQRRHAARIEARLAAIPKAELERLSQTLDKILDEEGDE